MLHRCMNKLFFLLYNHEDMLSSPTRLETIEWQYIFIGEKQEQ